MKPLIFVPEPISACGMDLLRDQCEVVAPWAGGEKPESDALKGVLYDCDAVIVRLFRVGADEIDQSPRLKVIAKHGAGVDNIDCAAATARAIPVVYTPTANANAVAEHAVALMLALARQIFPAGESLRAGRFNQPRFEGVELAGKTLGVVGLGRIGGRVAEIAKYGVAMDVVGYDPALNRQTYTGPAVLLDSLEDLLASADFVTLHLPLTDGTRHLIDAARLALAKPTCRIVNTSRGAVIDEAALAHALEEGQIAGAALDVFEVEPLPADNPLCRAPNALLTPHISSSTHESLDRMATQAASAALDVLFGRRPPHIANPEVFG